MTQRLSNNCFLQTLVVFLKCIEFMLQVWQSKGYICPFPCKQVYNVHVNAVTVVILCRDFGAFGGDACNVENIENLYHKGPEKRVLFIELVQIF